MGSQKDVEGLPALVLTVSDGVVAGTREDLSGEAVAERLSNLGFEVRREVVADEPPDIARIVTEAADGGTRLIVTSGGTGLGPRDRTPEAVMPVVDYVVPGSPRGALESLDAVDMILGHALQTLAGRTAHT